MARELVGWVRAKKGDQHGRWEVRFSYSTEAGERRQVRRLPKKPGKAAAEKLRSKLIDTLTKRGASGLHGAQMRFSELADKYEKAKLVKAVFRNGQKVSGRRSLEPPKIYLRVLREHFGQRYVRSIKHSDIEQYRDERLATKTINGNDRTMAATLLTAMTQLRPNPERWPVLWSLH